MFSAFKIFEENGKISGRIVSATLDELSAGPVVIKAAFSSVNYKDALAATGTGKIMRRLPLIGGIDVAGVVESSADAHFKAGDSVLVTGYDLGVAHDGGYAGYVRVPAEWVVPVPNGLSALDAMVIGTAGFTATLSSECARTSTESVTTMMCLPMPTESPGFSITIFTRCPFTNVPFKLPKSCSIKRPSS